LPARRMAILVDTSASMRRGDLWQQALRQAERELADLGPRDEVALFSFSDKLQPVVNFDYGQSEPNASPVGAIRSALGNVRPTRAAISSASVGAKRVQPCRAKGRPPCTSRQVRAESSSCRGLRATLKRTESSFAATTTNLTTRCSSCRRENKQ